MTNLTIQPKNYGSQIAFDPADLIADGIDETVAHKTAMKARNSELRILRKNGKQVRGWTLANQWRKYSGLGQPSDIVRNVYYINIYA